MTAKRPQRIATRLAATSANFATLALLMMMSHAALAETVSPQTPPVTRGRLPELKKFDATPGKSMPLQNSTAVQTVIEQSLQIAFSSTPCDSVLSPSQCLSVLSELPGEQALQFNSISLKNWATALEDIDSSVQRIVDKNTDLAGWQMLRVLSVQARHTVTKSVGQLEASIKDPNPTAKNSLPKSLLALNSTLQIRRIEIVHRLVVTGDRMMVDQLLIDRSSPRARDHVRIDQTPMTEIVDVTRSLEGAIANGLQILDDSAKAFVVKTEAEKAAAEKPEPGKTEPEAK